MDILLEVERAGPGWFGHLVALKSRDPAGVPPPHTHTQIKPLIRDLLHQPGDIKSPYRQPEATCILVAN